MNRPLLKVTHLLLALVFFVVLPLAGCQPGAQPDVKVEKVEPQTVSVGETLAISGDGFSDKSDDVVVKVGASQAQVKSSGSKLLVVELPKELQPGSYDVVVTNRKTGRSAQPIKLQVVEPKTAEVAKHKIITVPAGTKLIVRTVDSISSEKNRVGDTFLLTLDQPLMVNGEAVAAKGSEVVGRVTHVKDPGRVKGRAEIAFTLVELRTGGDKRTYRLATGEFHSRAPATKKRDAMMIGIGAGIGTAIGAIAGGRKGAAIGAGAGAGAGTGAVLLTKGKQVVIPSESRLSFRLSQPLEVQIKESQVATSAQK